MDLSSASKVDAENGERDSLLRRSEAGNGKVFVLPLRDRVLFPGLRAQALVHRSVYDAYVAHQRKLDDSTSLSKIITVGVKNDGEHEELHTVGTLCRMASSNALTTSQAGVDSNTHVILTLEGLDRVQLDLSTCIITYDNSPVDIKGTQQEGGRSVVCGKAEVSRILHSVQKGSSEEIEALAAGLQRKIAELFKVEKRLQTVTNGKFRQTGLPGPLGGLVASLWNDRSLGGLGEGGEKAITDVPIRAEKCSLFADIICATLKDVPMAARQKALECLSIEKRLHIAKDMVDERRESLLVANRVRNNIRRQADMDVRERVIRRQIQELQGELKKIDGGGGNEDELTMLTNKLAAIDLPKDMRSVCDRELHKMQNTPTTHPDYTVSRTYLETVASLPWALDTGDVAIDLEKARYVLDRDHFGMAKVKKRLMEYLAVVKLHQGEASSTVDEQQQQRSMYDSGIGFSGCDVGLAKERVQVIVRVWRESAEFIIVNEGRWNSHNPSLGAAFKIPNDLVRLSYGILRD
ncbi:hypothetical protein FOL47_002256 [Perkinsus chesapeaki]|uniref:Lon N-terminal domain-containing protein n=1 Tax=Perkinsus chesapeaki TaxID=330153 RepID=A0A7J6N0B3_PERCH|nr:hypothetical protein FOL47_002256 [Perkinsus chesapeaki]